jgi:hypothetical protein
MKIKWTWLWNWHVNGNIIIIPVNPIASAKRYTPWQWPPFCKWEQDKEGCLSALKYEEHICKCTPFKQNCGRHPTKQGVAVFFRVESGECWLCWWCFPVKGATSLCLICPINIKRNSRRHCCQALPGALIEWQFGGGECVNDWRPIIFWRKWQWLHKPYIGLLPPFPLIPLIGLTSSEQWTGGRINT